MNAQDFEGFYNFSHNIGAVVAQLRTENEALVKRVKELEKYVSTITEKKEG